MRGALAVVAVQAVLLAGCGEFAQSIGLNRGPDYAMAAPEPVPAQQPIPQAAPPPVAQSQTPPQGRYGVQIGAPRSVEEARAFIDSMRAKYPNELGQQWATILPVSLPKGVFYRVMIGPLASEQQASQLCSSLRAQGNECFIRRT
jgi:cell division septation protein DedD